VIRLVKMDGAQSKLATT